jgi:predicted alpha/beta hydrolase family esterase
LPLPSLPKTRPILLLPGFGNSGPDHWQSLWERTLPSARRVDLGDWTCPSRARWTSRLDAAVASCSEPPVLVAHSLGVIAVVWWGALYHAPVRAALLVAAPDMTRTDLPAEVLAFGAPPPARLRFDAVLASSSNDPYCELAQSQALAEAWGARFVDLGPAGHVNTDSGHGPWPDGERLLAGMLE